MATNVDLGGDTLYVNDIVYGDTTPGSLSGTSLSTRLGTADYISVTTATATAGATGSVYLLNRTAGTTVTLPAPVVGTTYGFYVGTVPTTGTYKIITDAATTFLTGGVYFDKSLTITRYDATNTTTLSINLNGTTTGGATIGDYFTLKCITSTMWAVEGTVSASGTLATPFATS